VSASAWDAHGIFKFSTSTIKKVKCIRFFNGGTFTFFDIIFKKNEGVGVLVLTGMWLQEAACAYADFIHRNGRMPRARTREISTALLFYSSTTVLWAASSHIAQTR
jgi:hypothetical protein